MLWKGKEHEVSYNRPLDYYYGMVLLLQEARMGLSLCLSPLRSLTWRPRQSCPILHTVQQSGIIIPEYTTVEYTSVELYNRRLFVPNGGGRKSV